MDSNMAIKQIRNAVEVWNADKRVVSLGVSKTTPDVFVHFHLSITTWLFHTSTSSPLSWSFSIDPTVPPGTGTHLMSANYEYKSSDLPKSSRRRLFLFASLPEERAKYWEYQCFQGTINISRRMGQDCLLLGYLPTLFLILLGTLLRHSAPDKMALVVLRLFFNAPRTRHRIFFIHYNPNHLSII